MMKNNRRPLLRFRDTVVGGRFFLLWDEETIRPAFPEGEMIKREVTLIVLPVCLGLSREGPEGNDPCKGEMLFVLDTQPEWAFVHNHKMRDFSSGLKTDRIRRPNSSTEEKSPLLKKLLYVS